MKNTPATFPKWMIAGIIAAVIIVAAVMIAIKAVNTSTSPDAQNDQALAKDPDAVVAAIVDGMNRSDADGVLSYVDTDALFGNLTRLIFENDLGEKLTDEQFDEYMKTSGAILLQSREALSQGIKTQSHKDGAPPGSVLYAFVHISEGIIERSGNDRFAVVYADGSFLEFRRTGGAWKAASIGGLDKYFAGWRTQAEEQVRSGNTPTGPSNGGGSVNAPSGR